MYEPMNTGMIHIISTSRIQFFVPHWSGVSFLIARMTLVILKGVYLCPQVLIYMRRTEQTKLSEFTERKEETPSPSSSPEITTSQISTTEPPLPRPKGKMWYKTTSTNEKWGVCNFDGTVLLVRLIDDRIHAHGEEAVCKWCSGVLVIDEDKVFCNGACKRYQGEFSENLNAFLHWEGVKSYTLRKMVAEVEGLELESRDLEPISYVPNWSILYEYADDMVTE